MAKTYLERIGGECKAYRERLNLLQSDVAADIGCSKENISAFENGRNNSARIFAWYIENGLQINRRLTDEI